MWNDLTMSERADVIKMAVKAGLRDMKSIKKFYDDSLKYAEGGPKVTIVDNDKVRMSPSGTFSDDNGNIIGDSVVLPEVTVKPTTPQTNNSSYYQQWLMREADRGGRNMSSSDREAYDRMMSKVANQNEVKNFTGFDGTIYKHGSGALEQVSPEFDILTLGRQFYTDGLFNAISKGASKKVNKGISEHLPSEHLPSTQWTPEQWTAAQDAAIAKGDMAEAQRLRDLHSEIKGYSPIHEYHGSNTSFKEFKESPYGIYFTPDKSAAEDYARGFSPTKYDVYLNSGNDIVTIDNSGLPWNKIHETKAADAFGVSKEDLYSIVGRYNAGAQPWYYDYLYPFGYRPKTNYYAIDQLAEAAKQQGKTSLKLVNAVDNGKKITAIKNKLYDQHIVFKPNQIKSADAVTYDDNGIRIPLGERDNFKINDFRYGIIPLIGGASLYKNKKKVK